MTYFHMGIHTIIGAKSFHCPVRDGKEWDQLAMVVRITVACTRHITWPAHSEEVNQVLIAARTRLVHLML
jgi:hypothetical protein